MAENVYGGGQYGRTGTPYGRTWLPNEPSYASNWSYEILGATLGNALNWPQDPSTADGGEDFLGGCTDFAVLATTGATVEDFVIEWSGETYQLVFGLADTTLFDLAYESFETWFSGQFGFQHGDVQSAGFTETFTPAGWTLRGQLGFATPDFAGGPDLAYALLGPGGGTYYTYHETFESPNVWSQSVNYEPSAVEDAIFTLAGDAEYCNGVFVTELVW